jgi:hypothetical protein
MPRHSNNTQGEHSRARLNGFGNESFEVELENDDYVDLYRRAMDEGEEPRTLAADLISNALNNPRTRFTNPQTVWQSQLRYLVFVHFFFLYGLGALWVFDVLAARNGAPVPVAPEVALPIVVGAAALSWLVAGLLIWIGWPPHLDQGQPPGRNGGLPP